MIPAALAGQLHQGLADFLGFSFWSSTPGMAGVVERLLAEPGALVKGPYVSLRLPFVLGHHPRYLPSVPLDYPPYLHQEQAFERLAGERKLSTLVATGTGSGKTESFLLPILEHCLSQAGKRGVKAILIYPMNALATDQAGRIARLIHGNDELRGRVTAGLYIGQDLRGPRVGETRMGPDGVITDRTTMQHSPPDVLLTNYKMLDYLLLRPRDQGIWRDNQRGTLRFLVVDELHTFDGAQGTDLACLIRRLKRRLEADDGSLCCVGTSATLGDPRAGAELRRYAEQVFGQPFDEDSVLGEHRLDARRFLDGCRTEWTSEPGADDKDTLDPARADAPQQWIETQVRLWFPELELGSLPEADGTGSSAQDAWAVALGDALKQHATFHALLDALGGASLDLDGLAAHLARQRTAWREAPDLARRSLLSLLGLVSAARAWQPELPEAAARREKRGAARPVQPFVEVRLQLWLRELTRMVATVERNPRLRHSADLDEEARSRHLPLVHCRECGAMGWGTVIQRDKPHLLRSSLEDFYGAYFRADSRVAFLFPRDAVPEGDPSWKLAPFALDSETLVRVEPGEQPDGPVFEVIRADSIHSTARGPRLSRDCPFCAARASLTIVGFRAATLTSVFLDQLFASPFNSDKKVLTFSDSVQDAAHRAGFFGSRTWRTNLRVALLQVIRGHEGLPLSELAEETARHWRQRMDEATWVSTFLAPDMAWLHDWETLKKTGELPAGSDLARLISRRLTYEVVSEFGLQAGIGRSLPRTGTATVLPDPQRVERAVDRLVEPLRNEVPGLRGVEIRAIWCFVVGLLYHLRIRGGILSPVLPTEYVGSVGKSLYPFKLDPALPGLGPSSRLPALLVDRTGSRSFDTWTGKGEGGWYARWVERCFGAGQAFTADPGSTYPVVLPVLVAEGLLREDRGRKGEGIWGVDETALAVTGRVAGMACDRCGHRVHVAEAELESWHAMPCLTARCPGSYGADHIPERGYFGRLYASGDLARVFSAEHTGLLGRSERERIEREFKAQPGEDPEDRKPWFPNLLSCTSTLEMGIDIGDLSVAVLCSVPPGQANYLQRIGRTGRRDGNSLVLTVANARPHELFFFAEPTEMLAGDVEPPGVFLDAPAVLERQLTAYCFDRWVAVEGEAADVPAQLRTVFSHLDDAGTGHFPFSLIGFVKQQEPALLREFGEMFADAVSADTEKHLREFMAGTDDGSPSLRWNLLEALHRERKQRDSLAAKANRIREEIKKLRTSEAQAEDHDEQLDHFEREKDALLSLVAGINRRHTLEFLTDEGLLPNYAFPESAVRLNSVIWRQKKDATGQGSKYETWSFEYKRSPAIALSELAPNADFYAGGRRVRIDQVDLGVSEVEEWRFCPECNHAQRIDLGDESGSCPACGTAGWRDTGQTFRLLKLQQVFANAPDSSSRIQDDSDDRQPRYFQRQTLVDVNDLERRGAWSLDDHLVPFGFEYLRRVTLREVNFGEPEEHGAKSTIAGQEGVRPGFQVCAQCGKVQTAERDTDKSSEKKQPQHALTCPTRKGGQPRIEECLYLYREFESEALRMLLPIGDPGSTRELHSFVAALQVGLRALFGGSVDHLKTTVYSDPVEGSNLRRQYLVLFDTVPGGTGYLKQLVTPRSTGDEMPLLEAMQLAVERIEGCDCWNDPDRDGCYRCLFAYRNSRDMEDTSARVASELLRRILERRGKLKTIRSLGEISISGLLDSVLEIRFIEALRRVTGPDGRTARLRSAVINQQPGYRWSLGAAEWEIEPQVNPAREETSGVGVSIDFVARPATARSDRRLAIFLDGWTFHKDRIGQDLRQRMALLASGRWDVWSLTWADLDAKLLPGTDPDIPELAIPDTERLKLLLQKMGLARYQDLVAGKSFDWLEAELAEDGVPWEDLAKAVLAARMRRALPADEEIWRAFVQRVAPPAARPTLAAMPLVLVESDLGILNPLFELMVAQDGSTPALLCTLDDREEHLESNELRAAWQGYLRFFQLLRRLPDAWFMTRSSEAEGDAYVPIYASRSRPAEEALWSSAGVIEEAYRELARRLMQAGVREPRVGLDIPDTRGDTWAEAELVWETERVAVASRAAADSALREPAVDWVVLFVEDLAEGLEPVLRALEHRQKVEEA